MLAATEHAKKVTDAKLTAMSKLQHARGELHQFWENLTWGVRYLEEKKAEHFGHLDDFRKKVEGFLVMQEEKLRRLSIEYDEELYPHLMSMIAERRYLLYIMWFLCVFPLFSLMRPLLFMQVVDLPWLASGCYGHIGVPRGRGGLWKGCGVRRCAWQGAGHGGDG